MDIFSWFTAKNAMAVSALTTMERKEIYYIEVITIVFSLVGILGAPRPLYTHDFSREISNYPSIVHS